MIWQLPAAASRESMYRSDWLLIFLADPALQGVRPRSLEPLRIQKGMFLLSMRGSGELADLYDFCAYDYGPFTPEIYRDLDALSQAGLVAEEAVAGRSWRTYRPTTEGVARAIRLAKGMAPEARQLVDQTYQFVTTHSFLALLRAIYAEFPEYAVNTVVKDAAPAP
jgi:uncharacterized protein YwgA